MEDRLEEWAQGLVDKTKDIDLNVFTSLTQSEMRELAKIALTIGYAQSASQFITNKKEKQNDI